MILYSFIKDALLLKNGVVKVLWESREAEEKENYYDLSDDQFAYLAQAVAQPDSGLKIIAHTVNQEPEAQEPAEAAS